MIIIIIVFVIVLIVLSADTGNLPATAVAYRDDDKRTRDNKRFDGEKSIESTTFLPKELDSCWRRLKDFYHGKPEEKMLDSVSVEMLPISNENGMADKSPYDDASVTVTESMVSFDDDSADGTSSTYGTGDTGGTNGKHTTADTTDENTDSGAIVEEYHDYDDNHDKFKLFDESDYTENSVNADDNDEELLDDMAEKRLQESIASLRESYESRFDRLEQSYLRLIESFKNAVSRIDDHHRLNVAVRGYGDCRLNELFKITTYGPLNEHVTFLHNVTVQRKLVAKEPGAMDTFRPKSMFDRWAYVCVAGDTNNYRGIWGLIVGTSHGFTLDRYTKYTYNDNVNYDVSGGGGEPKKTTGKHYYGLMCVSGTQKVAKPIYTDRLCVSRSETRSIVYVAVSFANESIRYDDTVEQIVRCFTKLYDELIVPNNVDTVLIGGHFGMTYENFQTIIAKYEQLKWLAEYACSNTKFTTLRPSNIASYDYVLIPRKIGFAENFPAKTELIGTPFVAVVDCLTNLWIPNEANDMKYPAVQLIG